jgi:ureidoacrylate peracid hydrolase
VSQIEVDVGRTALVVLDLQNYNVHPDGYWASVSPGLVERVEPSLRRTVETLAVARAAGIAVIHVHNAWRDGHPDINRYAPWQAEAKSAGRSTEGTWGVEAFAPVAPVDGEFVIRKRAVSALSLSSTVDFPLRVLP